MTRPGCGARGAGLGALPRSRSRRGSRAGLGFLRYKLGARRGGGGGEDRRESGPGLGAPAPLRVPAGQRRRRRPGLGVGSPGRRRLRAASLPAALPARWRRQRQRPRQTMNLRARRAEPRQVWARRPSAGFPRGYRGPQRGASPRRRSWPRPWRSVLRGHAGKGCPAAAPELARPFPGWRECSGRPGTEDLAMGWGCCGQLEACGGRLPTRTGGLFRTVPGVGASAPPCSGRCRRRTDGQTDQGFYSVSARRAMVAVAVAVGRGAEPPSLALRSREHFGEVSRRCPRQVGGHLSLSPLLWLGATSRPQSRYRSGQRRRGWGGSPRRRRLWDRVLGVGTAGAGVGGDGGAAGAREA